MLSRLGCSTESSELRRLSVLVREWADSLPEHFSIYELDGRILFDLLQDSNYFICFIVFASCLRQSVLLDKTFTAHEVKNVLTMTLTVFRSAIAV
jgi:hypothetical protein